ARHEREPAERATGRHAGTDRRARQRPAHRAPLGSVRLRQLRGDRARRPAVPGPSRRAARRAFRGAVVKLLSGFIAKQVARGLGKHVKPATLIKVTNTTRTPGAVSAGLNPTETGYRARGWIETYGSAYVPGSTTRREARQVGLLGASIQGKQIPTTGDK